ncbi:MAG: hypothetical protein ACK5PF_00730 [bacterium]|jgi:hypothetical protein
MRLIDPREMQMVSGGFLPAGSEELHPAVKPVSELVIQAIRVGAYFFPILVSPLVDDLYDDWKEKEEVKRKLEEDAQELYSQKLSIEIAKRLAAGEDNSYSIQGGVAYHRFPGATYIDDGADGTWDRKS